MKIIIIILINEQSDSSLWSFLMIFLTSILRRYRYREPPDLFLIVSMSMNLPLCRKYYEICENSRRRDVPDSVYPSVYCDHYYFIIIIIIIIINNYCGRVRAYIIAALE